MFQQQQSRFDSLLFDLKWFLEDFRPDVVHIHHLNHFGVEFLALLRRVLPRTKIVYTLHDYYLICPHDGLMQTTRVRPALHECLAGCMPCLLPRSPGASSFRCASSTSSAIWAWVDRFTAPSAFIRDRFIDWGLPASRIDVVRNGRTWPAAGTDAKGRTERRRNRFGVCSAICGAPRERWSWPKRPARLVESGFTDFTLDLFGEGLFQPGRTSPRTWPALGQTVRTARSAVTDVSDRRICRD